MRKPSVQDLVFQRCVSRQRPGDATTFYQHVQRNLVPEVRVEVQNYFGSLDELEAQYPGLDYTWPSHIRRLWRYPHHRRLFKVFAELGLTENEINSMCQWEGTKAAREKFIKETGREIPDLTNEGILNCERSEGPRAIFHHYTDDAVHQEEQDTRGEFSLASTYLTSGGHHKTKDCHGPFDNRDTAGIRRPRGRDQFLVERDLEQWLKDARERQEREQREGPGLPPMVLSGNISNPSSPRRTNHQSSILVPSELPGAATSLSRAHDRLTSMLQNMRNEMHLADSGATLNPVSPTRSRHATAR